MSLSSRNSALRRIAVVNPLNDYGIAGYTHEFAEGLASNGYLVSVYSDINAPLQELPTERQYDTYPVLGKALLKQATLPRLASSTRLDQQKSPRSSFSSNAQYLRFMSLSEEPTPALSSMAVLGATLPTQEVRSVATIFSSPIGLLKRKMRNWFRTQYLSSELAYHLRHRRYELVWTQWYSSDVFNAAFWRLCKRLKMPVVHTVHNVLPHECKSGDWELYNTIYGLATLLVVHSRESLRELEQQYPQHAPKAIVMPHGTYSSIHKRVPEARERLRKALDIDSKSTVLLFCGAIRPYKNIEGVIEALAEPGFSDVTLLIAGQESKYPDSNPNDPLQRTKCLLAQHKVACRVRIIPRMLETAELSEVLETSDVLLLPYLKGYGSGLLLLGMTFGKHIVATNTGGAEEYFTHYPNHTLLSSPSPGDVAAGLRRALARVRQFPLPATPPPELAWQRVTIEALQEIEERLAKAK